jgi:putative glutathione S-transferase
LGILEWAGLIPQSVVVKSSKFAWKEAWKTMTRELAPQAPDGTYARPKDNFTAESLQLNLGGGPNQSKLYLYTGNACPWCHRVHLMVSLLGLDKKTNKSSSPLVEVVMLDDDAERASRGGWVLRGMRPDPVFGAKDLREVYERAQPGYLGRCTAPLLVQVDQTGKKRKIVSTNSTNIMQLLNDIDRSALGEKALPPHSMQRIDLFPPTKRSEIDEMGDWLFDNVNNAVYQAGFSTTQEAHNRACERLFVALEELEARLQSQLGENQNAFLLGEKVTAVDLMLLPTLCRFDAAYAVLFKCSKKRVRDYEGLSQWMRTMFRLEGSVDTFDLEEAKRSYFQQLFPLNPSGIVPYGPDWTDLGINTSERMNQEQQQDLFHYKQ